MKDDAVKKLGNAVVKQAVIDYIDASKGRKIDKRLSPEYVIGEVEQFFTSQYFMLFTDLDGEVLLKNLKKKIKTQGKTTRLYRRW